MTPDELTAALVRAHDARDELLAQLSREQTDCYRLFHGTVEGWPGVTLDRYGDVALLQSFHTPVDTPSTETVARFVATLHPAMPLIVNDRSGRGSRVANPLSDDLKAIAHTPRTVREHGIRFRFQARHAGQDPWLFLDLRAARRWVKAEAAGRSVLNLFAYTCGVGTVAAQAGASFVMNVDFAESALRVGKDNARENELPRRPRFVHSDIFPAVRQLAGIGQAKVVRGKRLPPFPELAPRQFDLVFLDPPRYAKSPFGVVDLVRDYPALFKPALLATAEGGTIVCCNNVAEADADAWLDQLRRSAAKAGRTVRDAEWIVPDADFPSFDGRPPLKTVALRV
ncbi:MAG: class I SAM-dependent rRNA methyltransferase [Rhodocyclaceae bacterium]|nr:class I SAM-dependent rRNA methyltransferase [Rhodocyclaceae bacterium]